MGVLEARRRYQENPTERSAVAPDTQEEAEVAAVGVAVAVDVRVGAAPGGEQEAEEQLPQPQIYYKNLI